MFQELDEEKKKIKENCFRQRDAAWRAKLKEKILDIQNLKQIIISLKTEYKKKYDEFINQHKNSLLLVEEKYLFLIINSKIILKK